jgi:hypothetical protein
VYRYRIGSAFYGRVDPDPDPKAVPVKRAQMKRKTIPLHTGFGSAFVLNVNIGINLHKEIKQFILMLFQAAPYHAGLNPSLRSQTQDQWIQVISYYTFKRALSKSAEMCGG